MSCYQACPAADTAAAANKRAYAASAPNSDCSCSNRASSRAYSSLYWPLAAAADSVSKAADGDDTRRPMERTAAELAAVVAAN